MQYIKKELLKNNVYTLKLSKPQKLNAMCVQMGREFNSCINEIEKDNKAKGLIITGEGKFFSSGGDLNMLKDKVTNDPSTNMDQMGEFYSLFLSYIKLHIPVIGIINGGAIGAGASFPLAFTRRVATKSAKIGFNFSKLRLFPGMGSTHLLPSLVGIDKARDILLFGKTLTSKEALEIGLIDEIIEDDEIEAAIEKTSQELAHLPSLVTKQIIKDFNIPEERLKFSLDYEAKMQAQSFASEEFKSLIQSL